MNMKCSNFDRSKLFLVTCSDQSLWQKRFLEGKVPDRYYYGVNHLERYGFKVLYRKYPIVHKKKQSLWHKLYDVTFGRIVKKFQFYFGIQIYESLAQLRFLEDCQFVLTFFENYGMVFGFLKRIGFPLLKKRKIIVVVCWLSNRMETKGIIYRIFVRFAIGGIDCLLVYSHNQIKLISSSLGISEKKIHYIPFGIDTHFFQTQKNIEMPAKNFVLSIGSDSGRDYNTLIAAAGKLPQMNFIIVGSSQNLQNISTNIPDNVEIHLDISHVKIRHFYQTCKFGAIVTYNYPYPSGSTVLQEMNSMGKACVVTRTEALTDFVNHGENALFVEPGNVQQVIQTLTMLWDNDNLRQYMEIKALEKAHEQFSSPSAMEYLAKKVLL